MNSVGWLSWGELLAPFGSFSFGTPQSFFNREAQSLSNSLYPDDPFFFFFWTKIFVEGSCKTRRKWYLVVSVSSLGCAFWNIGVVFDGQNQVLKYPRRTDQSFENHELSSCQSWCFVQQAHFRFATMHLDRALDLGNFMALGASTLKAWEERYLTTKYDEKKNPNYLYDNHFNSDWANFWEIFKREILDWCCHLQLT